MVETEVVFIDAVSKDIIPHFIESHTPAYLLSTLKHEATHNYVVNFYSKTSVDLLSGDNVDHNDVGK